jgi:hypothetical protein
MTITSRLLLMLISIALAFWVGRRLMWHQEILSWNPLGVELEMLSMVPDTALGLPMDGWVATANSVTLGTLAIRRPRAFEAPSAALEHS